MGQEVVSNLSSLWLEMTKGMLMLSRWSYNIVSTALTAEALAHSTGPRAFPGFVGNILHPFHPEKLEWLRVTQILRTCLPGAIVYA